MLGLGLSIPQLAVRGLRLTDLAAAIRALFAAGEQGVWYDPSDLTTLFQDAAGTTPVTAVEQPVGRILDKSGQGNHATQTTSTSRPVLSARVNLLTKTEQFDDAAWTLAGATRTTNVENAPNGTLTADGVNEDTSNGQHLIFNTTNLSLATNTDYVFSCFLKANLRSHAALCVSRTSGASVVFDLLNGTVTQTTAGTNFTVLSSAIVSVGGGWYRCSMTFRDTEGVFSTLVAISNSATPSVNSQNRPIYTGDGTSGIYIWGADLRVANMGIGLPAYQRVNTATDYDTVGFPHYLRFDGADDWLVTPTITPGTDKAQVFAGVRKLSDAASGIVVEYSEQFFTKNGSFVFAAPGSSVPAGYEFSSRGSANVIINAGLSAPTTNIVTGISNISGDSAILRVNGTQAASSTADQGAGNYLAYPLYIGRRGGTTLPFNGHLYGLIVRFGANLPTQAITDTETWLNGKTRAYA